MKIRITNPDTLEPGMVYEIKCHKKEMSTRSQGQNIKSTYERLKDSGCIIGCGNKDLVSKHVDMREALASKKEQLALCTSMRKT